MTPGYHRVITRPLAAGTIPAREGGGTALPLVKAGHRQNSLTSSFSRVRVC